jgi:hypothetical protein
MLSNGNRSSSLKTLGLVTALIIGLSLTGLTQAAASTPTNTPVYVGVPPTAQASYFGDYAYRVTYGSQLYFSGNYNYTLNLSAQTSSSKVAGVVLQLPLFIRISNVEVSKGYNATFAGKYPPSPSVITTSEYTGNFSISPYFIISPNAPNGAETRLLGENLNITVQRVASYSYSYASVSFNAPALIQRSYYLFSGFGGVTSVNATYAYDAASGLLIHSSNTTLESFQINGKTVLVNRTANLWMTQTNLKSIDPSGAVAPATLPTYTQTSGSGGALTPLAIVLVIIIVILVILVVALFLRKR